MEKRNLKSKTDELRSIGKKLCDEHVCMCMSVRQFVRPSICLSVCDNISGTIRPYFTNFLCMLTMAIVRSSSGCVAKIISYTSGFVDDVMFAALHKMARNKRFENGYTQSDSQGNSTHQTAPHCSLYRFNAGHVSDWLLWVCKPRWRGKRP